MADAIKLKSTHGWLEVDRFAANPTDVDTAKGGFAMVGTTPKYYDGTSWTTLASASVAYDDIGDPDGNGSISFAGYTGTYTSSTANWAGLIMSNSNANPTAGANLLTLTYNADGDTHGVYLTCSDNAYTDVKFKIEADGKTTIAGTASGTDALILNAGDILVTAGNIDVTTGNITVGTGNIVADGGQIRVSADNQKLTLGASDATDSYMYFDGTNLVFYDSSYGSELTFTQLATIAPNPVISGDITITDGSFTWTDTVDEQAATWSFAGTAATDIGWDSSATTGICLAITANAITSGTAIKVTSSVAGFAGKYIQFYDGTADDFSVGLYGATIIAGNASTDVLTVTAGDVQITAGDIDVDLGIITVDNTADESNYIKRNYNGAGTAAVLQLQNVHASGTNNVLFVNQDGTGAATAMLVDSEGTGDLMTLQGLSAAASILKATAEAATGTVFEGIAAASSTVAALSLVSSGTGATGWLGANGVGMAQITCDGNLAHANASCLLITYSGTGAATGLGTSLRIVDTGATATSYAAYISAATGEALYVDAGKSVFHEDITLGVTGGGAGANLIAYGNTNGKFLQWDQANDLLFLTTSTVLRLGGTQAAADGITFDFDGADTDIDAVTANDNIKIGSDVDTNLLIYTASGVALTSDHGADTITLSATADLIITSGAVITCAADQANGIGLTVPVKTTTGDPGEVGTPTGALVYNTFDHKLLVHEAGGWVEVALA